MRYFVFLLICILTGCSTTRPKSFDSVEYEMVVKTIVFSTRLLHQCSNDIPTQNQALFMANLNENSMILFEYERNLGENRPDFVAATQIRQLVIDLAVKPAYAKKYCFHKLSEIQSAARTFARSLGQSEKFDICSSDVTARYDLYSVSFKSQLITKIEFDELVADITRLGKVDTASCSIENKEKLMRALSTISKLISVVGTF